MNADRLSGLLRRVHLRGATFYYVSFREGWVGETPGSREMAEALMPGAEHAMAYHFAGRKRTWHAEPIIFGSDVVPGEKGRAIPLPARGTPPPPAGR